MVPPLGSSQVCPLLREASAELDQVIRSLSPKDSFSMSLGCSVLCPLPLPVLPTPRHIPQSSAQATTSETRPTWRLISERPRDQPSRMSAGHNSWTVLDRNPSLGWRLCRAFCFAGFGLQPSPMASWCLTHIPHAAVYSFFPSGWLLRVFLRIGWVWRFRTVWNVDGLTPLAGDSSVMVAATSLSLTDSTLEEL